MTDKFIDKAKQLGMNPTECNWFQFFAQETWDRIGFARTRKGMRIFETTITQNLIFEFQSSKEMYLPQMTRSWGIEILEAINESANGNDIELFIEVDGAIIFFAIQAKIISHKGFKRTGMVNGKYLYLGHQVGANNQIDLLIDYAKRKKGIPLYLLYNYVKSTFSAADLCSVNYEIEQFGCSIISASYLRNRFLDGGICVSTPFLG